MGSHKNIGHHKFPTQGAILGREVRVTFSDTTDPIAGKIVRDDMQAPYLTIIKLDDDRCILSTECKYHFA